MRDISATTLETPLSNQIELLTFPGSQSSSRLKDQSFRHVFIRDLIIQCIVGVLENEQHIPQRVRINLNMYVQEDRLIETHELPDVVCYDQIIQKVTRLMNERRFRLLETAGNQIAKLCLEDVRISRIRIMLEKLDVYTNAGSVGIEIWRSQPTTEPDASFAR